MSFELTHTYAEEVYQISGPPVVVLSIAWNEIPEDQKQLLVKILQAVRLNLESVQIVRQESLDLSAFPEPPSKVIAFVNARKGIAVNEKVTTTKTEMVVAEPLSTLLSDEAAKRKFWAALKTLFPS